MTADLATSIFTIVILILSVIMHEVAHGYAAYALGDPTAKNAGRLTLNPLAHIDLFGSIIVPAVLVLTNAGILFGWAKPVPRLWVLQVFARTSCLPLSSRESHDSPTQKDT
jgi:Zn-dependent protease